MINVTKTKPMDNISSFTESISFDETTNDRIRVAANNTGKQASDIDGLRKEYESDVTNNDEGRRFERLNR